MKKLFFLLIIINIFESSHAQQLEIKGRVTDEDSNVPLPGASISIKKTALMVTSDKDGYFTIANAPAKFILIVNYVGYKTAELPLNFDDNSNHFIDVQMSSYYKINDSIVVSASKRAEKITDAPDSIHVIGQKDLQQFAGSNVGDLASYGQGVEFVRMGVESVSFNVM